MSVNKLGSPLTPYLKTSSIFEGHPGANLATVGKLGVVHSGNVLIGVYSTLYEAYADGVTVGQLYGLGKLHPTGLIEGAGGEPEDPKLPEHEVEMVEELEKVVEEVEEVVEPIKGEGPGEEIVEITEEPEPVVIAEDCELVVYEVRIFTGYELKLCEQKSLITNIASQMADVIFNNKTLQDKFDNMKVESNELEKLKSQKEKAVEGATAELKDLKDNYDELVSACAKASAEGPAGEAGACQELAEFIAKGNLDRITILMSQIAELNAEVTALSDQLAELNNEVDSLGLAIKANQQLVEKLENDGGVQEKLLASAETKYTELGGLTAPGIGQMNALAVGQTSIASTCVAGGSGECCELPPGEEGDIALFNLEMLAKLMVDGGMEEPKAVMEG